MVKKSLSSKQIITWLCINYGLFVLLFFTLGTMVGKTFVVVNFILDILLCVVSFVLNLVLFRNKYKTPLLGKLCLLLVTLCLVLFICFAFLMPENGLPPVLFA